MLSFKLGVEVSEGAEYRESESCDNCGIEANVMEVRRYSIGSYCKERHLCLPCESLKIKS